jgi:hypothetical protein
MRCRHLAGYLLAASTLAAAFAAPAAAQVPTPLGATGATASGNLSYVAYDDKHDVYLYVHEILPNRHVVGRFIAGSGAPLGSEFVISVNALTFAVRPKVTYSRGNAGTDAFLVTYSADQVKPNSANIFGQLVRYTGTGPTGGTLVGSTIAISPNSLSSTPRVSQLTGDAAFNPLTGRFLVAWEDYSGGAPSDVMGRLFNGDGSPAGSAFAIGVGPGSQGAPALAFDWTRNRFMAVFSGSNPSAPNPEVPSAWGVFAYLLDGTTGAPASALAVLQGGNNIEAAVTYLPERDGFIAAWTGVTGGPRTSNARFMASTDTAASLPSPWFVMQASGSSVGAPRLDYDPVSRRVLVASMLAQDPAVGIVGGTVLDAAGTPTTGVFKLSNVPAAVSGTYYPTVRRGKAGILGVSYVNDYATAQFERFQFSAAQTPGPDYNCASNCSQPVADTDGDGVPDSLDACPTVFAQTANGCPTPVATSADFTGDGRPELIWQNVGVAGQVYAWFLTPNLTFTGGTFLLNDGTIPAAWSVVGTSDMTGDGKPDILWQNQQTGQVTLFIMNGATKVAEQPITTNLAWRIVATADLNGDKKPDLVWQNFATGQVYVWFMSASNGVATMFTPFQGGFIQDAQLNATAIADKSWRVVGVADVNNDGKPDLIWQHPTGQIAAWLLQGLVVGGSVDVPFADTTWKIRAVGDYNADGHPDLVFQKTDTGDIAAWLLNGASLLQGVPMGRVSLVWRIAGAK